MKRFALFVFTLIFIGGFLLLVNRVIIGNKIILDGTLLMPDTKASLKEHDLGQTFVPFNKRLIGLRILTDPQGLPKSVKINLELYEGSLSDGRSISNQQPKRMPLKSVHYHLNSPGSGWHTVQFEAVRLRAGKPYYFSVRVTNLPRGYKIGWAKSSVQSYYHGAAFINGGKSEGDFFFQTLSVIPLRALFLEFWRGEFYYKPVLAPSILLIAFMLLVFVFSLLLEKMYRL